MDDRPSQRARRVFAHAGLGKEMAVTNRPEHTGMARLALIADDEAPIRMVVAEKLRSSGYEVMDASDGEEALEKALARRPDIIVTDLQMPYMSGLEFAQKVAADSRTANVPVILLTARGHVLEPAQLATTGIRKVMAKPFSARELVSVIGEVLAEASAQPARVGQGQSGQGLNNAA